jgi:hypothetical protein
MTLPANIRLAMQVPFPAMVTGTGPISITKQNGVWTVGFSSAAFGVQNPPPNSLMNTDYVLTYDSVNRTYINVPIGSFYYTGGFMRFVAKGVNFNSANTDTQIPIVLPPGISRYRVQFTAINNASASISTATAGIFTGAGGTGQAIAANQAITLTAPATDTLNNTMQLAVTNQTTMAYNDATLFVRVGTAQGSPATADVIIWIMPLS